MCQSSTARCLLVRSRAVLTSFKRRGAHFDDIRGRTADTSSFRSLCPTTWTLKRSRTPRHFGRSRKQSPRSQLRMNYFIATLIFVLLLVTYAPLVSLGLVDYFYSP